MDGWNDWINQELDKVADVADAQSNQRSNGWKFQMDGWTNGWSDWTTVDGRMDPEGLGMDGRKDRHGWRNKWADERAGKRSDKLTGGRAAVQVG